MFPNISAEIARNNMTISSFAEYMHVSRKTVSNWLNGKNEIPASALVMMANLFKCSTDYLLGFNSNQKTAS
ncbi:MAG TPA: transcriptional regulator [Ruminococcaceae bacterium]|jgi:transcriptional regulator with XRE-family HTH domain|nr:transcriptional regulator [Oscillospiraceae bacterium]